MTQELVNILNYFFTLTPGASFKYGFILTLAAGFCFLVAIGSILYRRFGHDKITKKVLRPLPAHFIALALCLLIYVFFRINAVAVFSARIFLYILLIWLFWALLGLFNKVVKEIPAHHKAQANLEQQEQKYFLLKNKKRKGGKS